MRVVAGSARGVPLRSPKGQEVRPTGDRVRESLFNSLGSRHAVVGADFVDLFAGTGALGIEALSRGAARCVFVDSDRRSVSLVEENLRATRLAENSRVLVGDALELLAPGGALEARRFDVALADPPYAFDRWAELLGHLDAAIVVAESDREVDPGDRWQVLRTRNYGTTVVTILELAEAPQNLETES